MVEVTVMDSGGGDGVEVRVMDSGGGEGYGQWWW